MTKDKKILLITASLDLDHRMKLFQKVPGVNVILSHKA
jgi:hypothetical protein